MSTAHALSDELTVVPSTCTECSVHCGSLVSVKNGVVEKISPNPAHPVSKGIFCIKGFRGPKGITYAERRLLHPMRRTGARGEGRWQRVSWDEALNEVAEKFAKVRTEHGPMSLVGTVNSAANSRGAAVALLMRSLGSPNWMINQDLCGGCRAVSSRATGLDITRGEDIEHADCALVVGRNPYEADPVEWNELKALKKRGGRIVVIDPKRQPLVKLADVWLRPRPGTDAALGLAMIDVMIERGLYDRDFVEQWCHGFEALCERARKFSPDVAEKLTGVAAADIVAATEHYARGPSTFVSGHGIDAFSAGVQTFRAFHCLVGISGNVDRLGGNRRSRKPPGYRDGLAILHDPEFRLPKEVEEQTIGASQFPLWAGPRGWQTACHNPSVINAILTGKPYPIRGMYVSGVNIVVTYPNTRRTVEALKSLDVFVVATDNLTPTAEFADIVLPKTTGLEEDDMRVNGPALTMSQAVVPPRGETRCDFDIAVDLLERMERRGAITQKFLKWKNEDEFHAYQLSKTGLSLQDLRKVGFATFPYQLGDFDKRRFPSSTGKVELYSEAIAGIGLDPLPDYAPPSRDSASADQRHAFPLTLLTGDREKTYHHSRFRDQAWAKAVSPEPTIVVHPETAREHALSDQQWVLIETPGSRSPCRLRVKISDATPAGVLSTGMGWWRPGAAETGQGAFDVNINAAMTYDGPWDPISGSVDTRGICCRIRAA